MEPIDTAPRDGTKFLGYDGEKFIICSWSDERKYLKGSDGFRELKAVNKGVCGGFHNEAIFTDDTYSLRNLTHWCHLPIADSKKDMEGFAVVDMPPSLWKLYVGHGRKKTKSKEYRDWLLRAHLQIISQKKKIGKFEGRVSIHVSFKRIRANCDFDNYIKALLDMLQSAGVLDNDKNCEEFYHKWHYQRENVCYFKIEAFK